jgi:hypothetical protein
MKLFARGLHSAACVWRPLLFLVFLIIINIKSQDHHGTMIIEHAAINDNRYKCCVAFEMKQKDILGLIPGQFKGQEL